MEHKIPKHTLELLAPAHDLQAGRAAVDCGADAVYIGGPGFGARLSAGNSIDDIARLVEYARPFGVRVYAALNTLVFEDELAQAEKTARELIGAGVDALIVQDMAYLRMGLTGVELHASTQMCNCTPEKIAFLGQCGFSRAILERGLTLEEIRAIRGATEMELECFVHGAICVGFSGQCYMSRSMSSRSGNRGDCTQSCRLTYDLLDAEGNVVIKEKHLLSVRDLNLSDRIPQLIDAGITSFKIEGRLKDSNYVRNVVGHYRKAIDRALAQRPGLSRSSSGRTIFDFDPDPSRSFSRGSTTWMLDGKTKGQASFSTPKATGEYVGKVARTGRNSFALPDAQKLHPGDGICFIVEGELTGTNVNRVDAGEVFPNRMEGITPGTEIFRNYDHLFNTRLERSRTRRIIDISVHVQISPNNITVTMADVEGNSARATESIDYGPARDGGKMEETVRSQLSKLGDTLFNATEVTISGTEGLMPFIPASKLGELRREVVEKLLAVRLANIPRPHPQIENPSLPYPGNRLGGEANITNSLAQRFYTDHCVEVIEEPFELLRTLSGKRVMTTSYCLRRELGQCLKCEHTLKGPLRLRRGAITWLLDFDCTACRMDIIKD